MRRPAPDRMGNAASRQPRDRIPQLAATATEPFASKKAQPKRKLLSWIRDVVGIVPDDGIEYLSDIQLAALNAELADIGRTVAWRPISTLSIE